ncbi:MAG: hypothetical protein JO036_14895 [Candidatus Eremiobacteraeota bacterium]|nr:hypothetical protein [Candidatus Eremiobacteraeota bacterium]
MALSPITHLFSTPVNRSPFAALAERTHAASGAGAPQAAQGSFSAHLTLTLYGADGLVRNLQNGAASLTGAPLATDTAAVIEVQDAEGREISVSVRKDGTFVAVEHAGGGIARYDSRAGSAENSAQHELANRAARIAGLAVSSGTGAALATGAQGALAAAAGGNGATENVSVTITDTNGVSRYAGGADGVVSAWRTTADVALESVTLDHGVQTDAVRRTDGSGSTKISGGALGGTMFVLTHDRDGAEHVDVTSGGGQGASAGEAAVAAFDAFGERITIGAGSQGDTTVELTDAAGTSFELTGSLSGASASLSVNVGVGDTSGTRRAELTEDATAISATGSDARATTSLVATARDAKHAGIEDGTLALTVDASVVSAKGNSGVEETRSTATLGVHARAGGTLDVAGVAAARVDDGFRDENGKQHLVAGSSTDAEGGVSFEHAVPREIVAVEVDALGDDLRSRGAPQTSTTNDDGMIAIDAFGHRTSAMRHDDISRIADHVTVASRDTLL